MHDKGSANHENWKWHATKHCCGLIPRLSIRLKVWAKPISKWFCAMHFCCIDSCKFFHPPRILFLTVNSPDSGVICLPIFLQFFTGKTSFCGTSSYKAAGRNLRLSHCSEHSAIEDFFRSWKLGINRYTRDQSTVLNLSLLINRPCLLCSLR